MRERPQVSLIIETSLISGREILRGIAQYVREHGPWLIYHEPRSLEAAVPRWLESWKGDGIIARLQTLRIADAVASTGLPAVDVLGVTRGKGIPLVHVDDTAIGRVAAEHLLDLGFRNLGWCGIRGINWAEHRREAFVEAVEARGAEFACWTFPSRTRSDSSWEAQQDRLAAWVAQLPKPAGIMACYDPAGQRVLEACRRAGVAVPDDVAVLGVDNDETVCEVCDPPLSSVATNHARVGYEAAALLDRLMRGKRAPKSPVYIEPLGVVARRSTDAMAVCDSDVAAALRFIDANACNGITVRHVAEHVSISHTSLKEKFRRLVGRSVHDEIIRVRILAAKQLLAGSELPLRQVARQVGFRHQEYMGVVFKRLTGKTPGTYRQEAQL